MVELPSATALVEVKGEDLVPRRQELPRHDLPAPPPGLLAVHAEDVALAARVGVEIVASECLIQQQHEYYRTTHKSE